MEFSSFRSLDLYKKADLLVLCIYRVTKKFPRDEIFGLTSQMRRASVSVVANIVEGYGRRTANDKSQFYYIARGSLHEVEYYIDLALRLDYLDKEAHSELKTLRDDVGKLLKGFIYSLP